MLNWLQSVDSEHQRLATHDDDYKIDSPSLIYKLLKRTCDQHCLLNVTFDTLEATYGSVIVQLSDRHDTVVLDELTPADGMARLHPNTQISISTLLNNLQLTFTTTVAEVFYNEGSASIHLARPACVYYAQHRGEHRVAVPMNWPLSASLVLDVDHCITAVVRDLSASGFSARLDAPLPEFAERLDGPIKFSLALGADRIVEGELEICHVDIPEFGKFRRIGTRIVALSAHDKRIIEQCVAAIDRQQSRLS